MRLNTSVFSVVVIAVFLCVLDKHVFGEVACSDPCPLAYDPVCGDNGEEHVRFNTRCELERTNSCNNRGQFNEIPIDQCKPRQAFTPPT
uniref:Salivary secreted kazaltype proteinase inhibitor n=1 Tax=Triatoma matogrossensis TaxID=162370 RepID=E2J795_9HEMI